MTEPEPLVWADVTGRVERVLRGEPGARAALAEALPGILAHPWLLLDAEDAGNFALFVALLREAGEAEALKSALVEAYSRVATERIPAEGGCATHNRLGVLFIEAGEHLRARSVLGSALSLARGRRSGRTPWRTSPSSRRTRATGTWPGKTRARRGNWRPRWRATGSGSKSGCAAAPCSSGRRGHEAGNARRRSSSRSWRRSATR